MAYQHGWRMTVPDGTKIFSRGKPRFPPHGNRPILYTIDTIARTTRTDIRHVKSGGDCFMPTPSSTMHLDAYLARIGYTGTRQPDLATLCAVHRAHLTAIPYENLDIHLGRVVSMDPAQVFDKLVHRGRGGWCYEMNMTLAWALRELGFNVTMVAAAVGAQSAEDRQHLDHMALIVTLPAPLPPAPWLLDVGFGNAFLDPLPLRVGTYQQAFHTFHLRRDGDYWCFQNHALAGSGFEFLPQPRTLAEYGPRCTWLQTAPESGFVRTPVCHRLFPDHSIHSLRGLTLATVDAQGKTEREIMTLADYQAALTHIFALQLAPNEIATLWEKAQVAHQAHLARLRTLTE